MAPGEDVLKTLESGLWSIGIDAARGGGILFCRYRGEHVLRPASVEHSSFEPLQLASFPLVPFSNRIHRGRFVFDGREVVLPENMPGEPNAIHGQGWMERWEVVDEEPARIGLRFAHAPGDWPWSYVADQVLSLDADRLSIEMRVTNTSDTAMPAGLGMHPYFVRTNTCRIRFDADRIWTGREHGIPDEAQFPTGAFAFSELREVGDKAIDHCYGGWNGQADIVWPETGLGLSVRASEALRHLVVYAPPGEDFFCLEPVSNMNNAVNWLDREVDTGLRILAPGETLSAEVTFTIREISNELE